MPIERPKGLEVASGEYPMISVVVPTARRPRLLLRAINSVLMQSISDFEVVVVVDGDDQESMAALGEIADKRLRVIQNAERLGSAQARNVGITAALGEWVAFLDDDDEWIFNKLELQLAAARGHDRRVIVSCLNYVVTPLGRYVWPNRPYDNTTALDDYLFDRQSWFRGDVMLQCSSLFLSRSLCSELMFYPEHDDWDLLLRAVKQKGAKIVTVPAPLVMHYTEDGRDTLGASFDWKKSLQWADSNRSLIGGRAYAGFCLTVIAPQAAKGNDYSAFWTLLWRAFRKGAPRPIHVSLYVAMWLIPIRRRQELRRLWYNLRDCMRSERGASGARAIR
jgi:glycosyltransferase involved in cell wall biosynthesis